MQYFCYLSGKCKNMAIFRLSEKYMRPVVFAATGLFLLAACLFFIPADIPHKVAIPVAMLTVASMWLCRWELTLAFLFSAVGDYAGSCGDFLGQMAMFAIGHIWFIIYFIRRYRQKEWKWTGKAKGYLAMVVFCIIVLLCIVALRILPNVEGAVIRTGLLSYAVIISLMLLSAMMQRSSLYALGAVLFVFSDFTIAWARFVGPVPHTDLIVLATYYLAQWLLFIRSTPYRLKSQIKLMRF